MRTALESRPHKNAAEEMLTPTSVCTLREDGSFLPGAQSQCEPSALHVHAGNFLIAGVQQIGGIER
jgi:hypothetical protein